MKKPLKRAGADRQIDGQFYAEDYQPWFDEMPDHMVLSPHVKLAFVEVKAHGKNSTPCR